MKKSVLILGTRGIPAAHGGFETFAEHLSLFLAQRGWRVAVYCQHDVANITRRLSTDHWQGVERVNVEVATKGSLATLEFDWRCIRDAATREGTCLVLGYNSALFLPFLRWKKRMVVVNMDGLEWRRAKWPPPVRVWFWINEWIAAWSAQRLVADHPAIADHLATRRARNAIAMIPYGGLPIDDADANCLAAYGLSPDRYIVSIARIEPENNILPIVLAFSRRARDGRLVILGRIDATNSYHRAVKAAAGTNVVFLGAIYDGEIVRSIRFHARAYAHGHSVGGTNPSLVEALWAGNAVIAHDNIFNRWTAGADQFFFSDVSGCDAMISAVFEDDVALARARTTARQRATERFSWPAVLEDYERELLAAEQAGADPAGAHRSLGTVDP